MGKIVISLYDYTTEFVKPWAKAGYLCLCVDIQHEAGFGKEVDGIVKVGMCVKEFVEGFTNHKNVVFLSAFPPCTDLAVSGAAHFANKLAKNPNYREEAMSLVYLARDFGEALGVPYFIENPVSVVSTQWRKPDYKFHPWEYGGYLPADDTHPLYPDYINSRDSYPKLTCLWTNDLFTMPEKLPVVVKSGYSKQHNRLGGKSLKTKNIRSATPRGFAKAVFLSNLISC